MAGGAQPTPCVAVASRAEDEAEHGRYLPFVASMGEGLDSSVSGGGDAQRVVIGSP